MADLRFPVRAHRSGFALLTALWLITGAAVLAFGASLVARQALGTSVNRMGSLRAQWRAEGCIELARWYIDALVEAGADSSWWTLPEIVQSTVGLERAGCVVEFEPVGSRLDVNTADGPWLSAILRQRGYSQPRSDSMTAALLDWRDADDEERPLGAEVEWYSDRHRPLPRNGDLADLRELTLVRGFERFTGVESVFTTEPGALVIALAPLELLAALPGMTPQGVERLHSQLARGHPLSDLAGLATAVDSASREGLLAAFATLAPLTTDVPEAWILRSRAGDAGTPVRVVLELRVTIADRRVAIVRRRAWHE